MTFTDPDYVNWEDWTECSAACGGGSRSRNGMGNDGVKRSETINCGMQTCDPLDPCECPLYTHTTKQLVMRSNRIRAFRNLRLIFK